MKSIANSQLTGKWYNIVRTRNFFEMKFVEIFLYISIAYENYLDLLYVGVKGDRSKVLNKITLKILTKNDVNFIIIKKGLFKKTFRILTFDDKNGILILSDRKMKYVSILSRKPTMKLEIVENYLNQVEELSREIELYSGSIV
ncbi:MAG: lipocalin family protein [Bacteroidales bacterium]|nr:lipocalin family protein [Bacteroidales bacterium]